MRLCVHIRTYTVYIRLGQGVQYLYVNTMLQVLGGTQVHTYMCMYVHMYTCTYTLTYLLYTYIYIYILMYLRMYFVAIRNENKLLTVSNNYMYNTYIIIRLHNIHSVHTYVQGY